MMAGQWSGSRVRAAAASSAPRRSLETFFFGRHLMLSVEPPAITTASAEQPPLLVQMVLSIGSTGDVRVSVQLLIQVREQH